VQLVLKVLPPSLSKKPVLWVVPPSQALQGGNENKLTTHELFQMEHKEQLKLAQDWIVKTSQSCSTVAILVATGVYAAAYSIRGGSDDPGTPIFLSQPFLLGFHCLGAYRYSELLDLSCDVPFYPHHSLQRCQFLM